MFIEIKDLKKKRNLALLFVIFLFFIICYLMINSKENTQRVESVIYTNKTINEKFGKITAYSIRRSGDMGYNNNGELIYSYRVEVTGDKGKGVVEFDMYKIQQQQKYDYTLKNIREESAGIRIRIGKS